MSGRSKVSPRDDDRDLSDFTSELLENLKGEFKNNLKRSANQPSKEKKLSLSILSEAMDSSGCGIDGIGDEVFIFNHIINCTKALIEVIGLSGKDCKSLFYKGLMHHIEKMVKTAMINTSSDDNDINSPKKSKPDRNVFDSNIDRLYLTSHSLMTFPHIATNGTYFSSKRAPLLHYSVFNSKNFDLVKAVYFSNPEAVRTPDADGALPLHWASLGTDVNIVQFLIDKYPTAAGINDNAGYVPLHWAVNKDKPCLPVYKLLIKAYPQGVSIVSPKNGTLPLHWCVNRSEPDVTLVKELIMAHSTGLRTPCVDGWLPLHYCVNHSVISLDVLKLLLNRYPKATMHKNEEGQLPVHRLLDRDDCCKKALKMILDVSPECLMVPDNEGYLPLHVALDGSDPPSWRLIKLLIQEGPEAVKMKTKSQHLPLHIAMKMNDAHGGDVSDPAHERRETSQQDEAFSDDEFNQETIDRLNANRYLSIIQELTSNYPAAVHDVAVDIVPVDPNVSDIYSYKGEWKKSRWTPMSRAISKGKSSPIALLLRPFQKQKKSTLKGAADRVMAANRMGGPLVSSVNGGPRKLGPIVVQKGDKVPRRPPPRAKKESQTQSDKQPANTSENIKKTTGEGEKLNALDEKLKAEKMAKEMAEDNFSKPRIYTADMKGSGYFGDNEVSVVDDDANGLQFNRQSSGF